MAETWYANFVLVDTKGLKTSLRFRYESDELALPDEFTAANNAMTDLQTKIEALTDANVYSASLTLDKGGSTSLPADADVTDVALISVYLTGAGVLPKFHTLRIPAPIDAIFEADLVTVDTANAALIALVAALAAGAPDEWVVSDGEKIVTDVNNGIKGGSWTSVKKTSKSVQSQT